MQQIERYGVIALVFLLVTIVAVSFWGDKKSPGFWARLTGRSAAQKEAIAGTPEVARTEFSATDRAVENSMPLTAPATNPAIDALTAPAPQEVPTDPSVAMLDASRSAQPLTSNSAPATSTLAPGTLIPPQGQSSLLASTTRDDASSSAIAADAARVYTVQKGDSLGGIARKTLGQSSRWPEIQAMNAGVDPKSLKVGMKLHLPEGAKAGAPSASSKSTASEVAKSGADSAKKPSTEKRDTSARPASSDVKSTPSASSKTYVVRAGDNLHQIAESKLGDGRRWQEIAKLNPGVDPKHLHVGQSIKLPAENARALVAQAVVSSPAANSDKPRVR